MTRRLIHILLLFLCMILGWALGYMKMPYIDRNDAFWIGVVGCLGLIGFMISLFRIWKIYKGTNTDETEHSSLTGSLIKSLTNSNFLVSIIIIALICACLFSYNHNRQINEELKQTQAALEDLKSNTNIEQQRINISLLSDLINDLDSNQNYIHDTPTMNHMVERIVSLSSSFKKNRVWDFANKVNVSLSEERGLLLLAILKTKMDSTFFNKIKANVSFYGADLRNADLHGLDLSGIDLKYANLEYANLQGVNLNDANLNGANLMGVNLNKATLVGTHLISATMNWVKANEVDFHKAKLDSALISNATAIHSRFTNASMIHTVASNSLFNESDFDYCVLMYTNVSNANFSKAIMTHAELYFLDLNNTIIKDAIIRKNWKELLLEEKNTGVETMLEAYQIICDSTSIKDSTFYRIISKTQ